MNSPIVFATDFHGSKTHFQRLFNFISENTIQVLIIGGDICPGGFSRSEIVKMEKTQRDFLKNFFLENIHELKTQIPKFKCFTIMGNDDLRINLDILIDAGKLGAVRLIHNKIVPLEDLQVIGYSFVPLTPFLLKDWEKYENRSQIIEPIAIPPMHGFHSTNIRETSSIEDDLDLIKKTMQTKKTIFVSHSPPYKTKLDQSTMDHYSYEGLKMDKHIGSTAIRKFIEATQPDITLHGHIHESTAISGSFYDRIDKSICINGAFKVENTNQTEIILIKIQDKISFEKTILN